MSSKQNINQKKPMEPIIEATFGDGFQGVGGKPWNPSVDFTDHGNEYVVKVELPGVEKEDVRVMLHQNILTVSGEKREEKESGGTTHHVVERSYGSFQRSLILPTTVSSDGVDAVFKDGLLTVTLTKAEEEKATPDPG
jgi:HSP20 family protein